MKKNRMTDSIYLCLLLLFLLAALLIWPVGLIQVKQEYKSLEYGMAQSGPITETTALSGIIQPVADKLDRIAVRFSIPNRKENTGILHFRLTDGQGNVIYMEDIPLCEMKNNKYHSFRILQKLSAGQPYIYEITVSGAGEDSPSVWLGSPKTACTGQVSVYCGGQEYPNNALIMQFTYHGAASFRQALPYLITLLLLSMLVLASWKGEHQNDR
ncbi:MAG: hypothetical protein GX234_07310 [Clostridiales bacterium]|nr:hypothetical protein [Clostridiales bacterium]